MIYLAYFILCINLLFQYSVTTDDIVVNVEIDVSKTKATVSDRFHGVAFDASLFTTTGLWPFVNITSKKLVTLLKGLSPGYFRVGGTFANWLFFDLDPNSPRKTYWAFDNNTKATRQKDTKGWLFRLPNNMPNATFDQLVSLTKESGMRLLFDLNAEIRDVKDGNNYDEWDQTEAIKLFDYCIEKGYGNNIDWELGNEPNHISAHNLTEAQVGKDFVKLYKLLQLEKYKTLRQGSLVGPDVGWMGVSYITGLANATTGNELSAFTIHQYYFNGINATEDTYMNASYFNNLQKLFDKVKQALKNSSNPDAIKKHIWIGETSGGYNSGTVNVSDTYVSGFLWLDKLGLSAANNIQVVIRQTIYNGFYGLLDKYTLDPFPDYWLTYVHNKLVGSKVFEVKVEDSSQQTRVYAQCTKTSDENVEPKHTKGALTIFALNVNDQSIKLNFKNPNYNNEQFYQYVLMPADGVLSREVNLNDKLLTMTDEEQLPILKGESRSGGIVLKGKTFGFFVFPNADISDCKN